jgi:predicted ABC-type ATPase
VARGGHDIPEDKIRTRYDSGRENLIRLLPKLASLHLYDNSALPDPETGFVEPRLILRLEKGQVI